MTYEMTLLENRMAGRAEGRAEGLAEGRAEGLAEGRAEGLAEGRKNFAFKMLLDGMSLTKIQKLTELPLERIKEIAAENSISLKVD